MEIHGNQHVQDLLYAKFAANLHALTRVQHDSNMKPLQHMVHKWQALQVQNITGVRTCTQLMNARNTEQDISNKIGKTSVLLFANHSYPMAPAGQGSSTG